MYKNLTLLLLHLTSLSSTSALFSPAAFSQRSYYNFQRLSLSKHYSSFLDLNSKCASSLISNSKFSYFLNSVVRIHLDEKIPQYEGISEQDNNPVSPKVSFICNHTEFIRNTSPFNGAGILVHSNINSVNSINAVIEYTTFNENTALMGGAIYYESSTFNMSNSHFSKNVARIGSHVFLSCVRSNVESCKFQEASSQEKNNGLSSVELTASESSGTYTFKNSQFFLDKAPFRANGVTANLFDCCFLDYNEGDYFNYNYDKILGAINSGSIVLKQVTINNKIASDTTIDYNDKINTNGMTDASDEQLSTCRLIPYPTQTSHYKISDEPAIFALVAIIFFVLVSIVGIFIVTCKKKKDIPPEDAVNEPLKSQK